MDALYAAVTPGFVWSYHDGLTVTKALIGRIAIVDHLIEQEALFSRQRFHEVVYHHLPGVTFMTCRISETMRSNGEQREQRGIECYTIQAGLIATKDVYRKPIQI